jgi:hypothetical protein
MSRCTVVRLFAVVGATLPLLGTIQSRSAALPVNAFTGIVEAFRTHSVVTLSDPHGDAQVLAFTLALLRDPRLPLSINDIVVENGNALHQAAMDRYIRGENVPYPELRKAWEDTTQAQVLSPRGGEIPEMYRVIRQVNASLPKERQVRVLLGDPPIDWAKVNTRVDFLKWLEMRDSYPAAVIQTEVLAKERKALVVYGQIHAQRKNILSNYAVEDPRMQTIVSILTAVSSARVFSVWTENNLARLDPTVSRWTVPSLAELRGTHLGSIDFADYYATPTRFATRDGELMPLAKERWRVVPIEQQFDAVLYLGPQETTPKESDLRSVCNDREYVQERLRRLSIAGPPPERDRLIRMCGN